ncbi:uncharacterized protein LOC127732274, partial [Mytilus californianus]|uniref:uncharacterized protein LOC127732274 n=1 Tax=Mytilus californianus TaxID=6549 RepID=UPI0022450416
MYTLQNLLPETYYELKMRSVYKDAKSHYSESMTKQTLKLVLPEAINQLSEEDKIRYKKLMDSSQTENRYFVRIMIVGKESAGKTCLLRRLLKESISDVSSTDGVDIVVRRCKINIEDGKWTIDKDIDDDKEDRIKRALTPNDNSKITTEDYREKDLAELEKIQKTGSNALDKMSKIENKLSPVDITHDVSGHKKDITEMCVDATKGDTITHHEELSDKENIDENIDDNGPSLLVMPEDLMSHVLTYSATNTSSNLYALCELWDFAGQKEFYATHQAFLTSNAVYLVVADMNSDISKQSTSQCFANFQDVGGYVDFWFDSIHCHRTVDNPVTEHFEPPILLVFTGKDKCDKAQFTKRKEELDKQIDEVLGHRSKYHHLHEKFYLSNTEDSEEEFLTLQNAIFKTARKMDIWGKAFPLKWILLEQLIELNKDNGKNFITFTDMVNMGKHPDINILKKKDLLMFLRFQHNVGNVIFFENIQD